MLIRKEYIDYDFVEINAFNLSKDEVKNLILYLNNLLNVRGIFFRATGLWENINEIANNFKNCKVNFYEGDKNKFFIKRFPEIHIDINDIITLNIISDSFVNIIYEGRYLYFYDEKNKTNFYQIIKDNIYVDNNIFKSLKNEIICLVQNIREYDDTGISIIINNEYSEEVIRVLNT